MYFTVHDNEQHRKSPTYDFVGKRKRRKEERRKAFHLILSAPTLPPRVPRRSNLFLTNIVFSADSY